MTTNNTTPSVDGAHPQYSYYLSDWCKVRDCIAGERKVKERGELYLPKLSARQKEPSYEAYKTRACFLSATERTKEGFVGSALRKPPTVTAPDSIDPLLEDIDLAGTTFEELVEESVDAGMSVGRAGILVEHEPTPGGRPYMLFYEAEEIVNWATQVVNGRRVLALVELRYNVDNLSEDGYSVECHEERRCLRLVEGIYQQTIRQYVEGEQNKPGQWVESAPIVPTMQGRPLDFIPFVFLGPKNTKPEIAKPPLLKIAELELSAYRSSADLEHGLHLVALPTPYSINLKTGEDAGPIELGPGVFHEFQGENGEIDFLEVQGTGLSLVKENLESKKEQMALLGAAFLTPPKREAETKEALELKSSAANSPLAKICKSLEKGLTQALKWLVRWTGADDSKVEVRLNKDFDKTRLSPDDIQKLSAALQSGAITPEVYAYLLEEAEILPPDVDAKEYAEELRAEKQAKQEKAQAIAGTMPAQTNGAPPNPPTAA